MKISTRGRYALRAMVDIASNYRDEPVVLSEVARRQEISEQYLEHLTRPLKVAGLVRSVRGAKGGFVLARPASMIKVGEIIRAVEGSMALVECVDSPNQCHRASSCPTRGVWVRATEAAQQVFDSITLETLIGENMDMCCPAAADIKSL